MDSSQFKSRSESKPAARNRRAGPDDLEALAAALQSRRDEVMAVASAETSLLPHELEPELVRTVDTFRQMAAAMRSGLAMGAVINTPAPQGTGPNQDVRSLRVPLGTVAVFGSSNFPFAYGAAGGDTASALAAGCSVIVKEHPAHPKTGRMVATILRVALRERKLDIFDYVRNDDPSDFGPARDVVSRADAVGFTGSNAGGAAIESLARAGGVPKPVFAEMGGINGVLLAPAIADGEGVAFADQLANSILARFGQQCTKPGVLLVPVGHAGDLFVDLLTRRFQEAPARQMLAPWIRDAYIKRTEAVGSHARVLASGPFAPLPCGAPATLHHATWTDWVGTDVLRRETFGPATLVVRYDDAVAAARSLPPALTGTLMTRHDDPPAPALFAELASRVGRVIVNGVPTGVRVCEAMVHGGPFPATNSPSATAVGTMAIHRWTRPVAYQNCPDHLLPPDLQDANPLGITRLVNGTFSDKRVTREGV